MHVLVLVRLVTKTSISGLSPHRLREPTRQAFIGGTLTANARNTPISQVLQCEYSTRGRFVKLVSVLHGWIAKQHYCLLKCFCHFFVGA